MYLGEVARSIVALMEVTHGGVTSGEVTLSIASSAEYDLGGEAHVISSSHGGDAWRGDPRGNDLEQFRHQGSCSSWRNPKQSIFCERNP